ncbi:unnamed protein product [Coccothraustes coccothraustes]
MMGAGSQRAGWEMAHPGRTDALGEHLLPALPSPWELRGLVPRVPALQSPEMLAVRAGIVGGHVLPPPVRRADTVRGGTAGARSCCAVPGGADGKPPPAFRHGIAISLRFW